MTEPPAVAVLFEDVHLVAVAKPAGLLTQAPPWQGPTLEQAVRHHLAPGDPGAAYLGTVHRLDRPVSGVVVWAKTPRAARRLSKQFAARATLKEYWSVVEARAGRPPAGSEAEGEGEWVWEDWLTRSSDAAGVVHATAPGTPGARVAVTRARVEPSARVPDGTLWLRLRPETGRTHQLRAQSALRVGPVWGDAAYGSARPFPGGIALHARALTLRHPETRQPLHLTAPLPAAWLDAGLGPPAGGG